MSQINAGSTRPSLKKRLGRFIKKIKSVFHVEWTWHELKRARLRSDYLRCLLYQSLLFAKCTWLLTRNWLELFSVFIAESERYNRPVINLVFRSIYGQCASPDFPINKSGNKTTRFVSYRKTENTIISDITGVFSGQRFSGLLSLGGAIHGTGWCCIIWQSQQKRFISIAGDLQSP